MELKKLIEKGYFPIELPPPFNSRLLGDESLSLINFYNALNNNDKKEYRESLSVNYSVPKVGLARRLMKLPNPLHQLELSKIICDHWNEIQNLFKRSKLSSSIQIEDDTDNRAVKSLDTYPEFKEKCLRLSFDKMFELRTDISKYFPTIYTHSIAWAIHTKEIAKQNRNDYTLLGNLLDRAVRKSQSGQTIGLPIGPDTSRIIAEILGCTFDKMITDKVKLTGFRYVDDCYFYFDSQADAEKVFKLFQSILTDFGLDISEEKTQIKKLPFSYESNWVIDLSNYQIRDSQKGQRTDLKNYISLCLNFSSKYPKESVLKFAIKKLFYYKIYKQNWSLFESLIFRLGISEPAVLPELLQLLLTYNDWVDKSNLKKLVHTIISEHIYKGHHFEVSWAMWIARSFSVKIDLPLAQKIFDSRDVISILIGLDMVNVGLINKSVNLANIAKELNSTSFTSEWWLLAYEAISKKWITSSPKNLITKSKFFYEMKKRKISFYDNSKQLSKIEFIQPRIKKPELKKPGYLVKEPEQKLRKPISDKIIVFAY